MLLALNSSSRTAELDRNCAVSVSAALFCCCWLNSCRVFLSGRSPIFSLSAASICAWTSSSRISSPVSARMFLTESIGIFFCFSASILLPLFCYCMHLKFRCGGRGMCPALHISFSLIGYSWRALAEPAELEPAEPQNQAIFCWPKQRLSHRVRLTPRLNVLPACLAPYLSPLLLRWDEKKVGKGIEWRVLMRPWWWWRLLPSPSLPNWPERERESLGNPIYHT